MIIGDENGKNGEGDSPAARVADGIDDVFELWRDVDAAILGTRQGRSDTRRVGVHLLRLRRSIGEKLSEQNR